MALSVNIPIRYLRPFQVLHNDSVTDTDIHQQTYEGLYDSYNSTHVTEDLLSGFPPNGMLAAAQLAHTTDSFYPPQNPLLHYGFDANGNICYLPIPSAIPPCCCTVPPNAFPPANPTSNITPPIQPTQLPQALFGYGPIIGGGVPPAVFELRHHAPSRESSVQSTALSNSIWSQVDLHPSPSLSFTESLVAPQRVRQLSRTMI